jgi:hypothetical protein
VIARNLRQSLALSFMGEIFRNNMGTPLSGKKRFLFFSVAIIFGLSLGLIASEVALRIAGPVWLRQFMVGTDLYGVMQYGSDAGWPVDSRNGKFVRFKPDSQFKVHYFAYKDTVVHIDHRGGRVVPNVKKADRGPLIPVLGDSFTFGLGVKDDETFINLLCANSDVVYLNLGAPGSALPNQLDLLEFRHQELGSPSLYVFVFYLGNDFSDMIRYYERSTNEESKNSEVVKFLKERHFIQRSYVAQFALHYLSNRNERNKHKTRYFRTPDGKRISNSVYLLMSQSEAYSMEAENVLNLSLDRLESLSKKLHFRYEFIVIPDKRQADSEFFYKQANAFGLSPDKLDRYYPDRFLEKNLEQRGIRYLDLMACLKERQGLYYINDDHFTAAGHRAVADCIHRNAAVLNLPGLQFAEKK